VEISIHLEKMSRLEELRGRLNPVEDFELWMWTSMTAATNGFNACLHHVGLTKASPYYAHQIPGLYVAPVPVHGKWQELFAEPGDLIHTGLDSLKGKIPEEIEALARELEKIEDLREPYVRGGKEPSAHVCQTCEAGYRKCRQLIEQLLSSAG
jgi:hypothetical protein